MAKEHFSTVKEYSLSTAGIEFRKMLNQCIEDLRIKNDTAEGNEFLKNQGAIQELKKIVKAIAPIEKKSEFNGAFDE